MSDTRDSVRALLFKEDYLLNSSPSSLEEDISYFDKKLDEHLDFYDALSPARKAVFIDICLSIGINNFFNLEDMLWFAQIGEYKKAADSILEAAKYKMIIEKNSSMLARTMASGTLSIKDEDE